MSGSTSDTSAIDDKKEESKTIPNDYVTNIRSFLSSIIVFFIVFIIYFSSSSLILYGCKLAQSNILPTESNCYPYTEEKPNIKPISTNIFTTFFEPQMSMKINFPYDEFNASSGGVLGTPILPFYIPATLTGLTFPPITIAAELITRAYTFQTSREKRFSSIQVDAAFTAGASLQTTFITVNPDFNTVINSYGSAADEDATLRLPVRKSGYYSQVKFNALNLRPSIRSVTVEAIVPGHMTQTRK